MFSKDDLLLLTRDIEDILVAYMSPEDAKERANNIAVLFSFGRQSLSGVEQFLVPSSVKSGIVQCQIRKAVSSLILNLGDDYV